MASSVIGALRVNLGLDSAQFSRGMTDAQKRLKVAGAQFKAVAAGAALLGGAITAMALKGAADIDKSAKAARRLGASVGGFRALELAAGEAGVSLSTLTDGVQTMDREIAKGSKNAMSALDRLGLSAQDLTGIDADEKLALVADRVKELGLDSGQASALLQDLGVRNREMVLAVLAGGDAFRNARKDVDDYGLALESTDSEAIEQANDRIGRLALIGQYAGQQLALELVPAMGRLAMAMTDSLREGGLLRTMIDGLANNIQRLGTYVAVAVTGFGVRYVAALVAARVATFTLSGALAFLRGALIRTGIGALIVAAGELMFWFGKLVKGAGGFGNAMELLGNLASAVWTGIKDSAQAIPPALNGVWLTMKANFLSAISSLQWAWRGFLQTMADGAQKLAGIEVLGKKPFEGMADGLQDAAISAAKSSNDILESSIDARNAAGAAFSTAGKIVVDAFAPARAAAAALRDAVVGTSEDSGAALDDAADSANRFGDALEEAGGGGGGGKGGAGETKKNGGAAALDTLKTKAEELKETMGEVKGAIGGVFTGLVTRAKTLSQSVTELIGKFAEMSANRAFEMIWSGGIKGGGGGLGAALSGLVGKIFGFASGTPYAPGGLSLVGERGPELVNLPRGSQVINAPRTRDMMGQGGGGIADVRVFVDQDGNWQAAVERISGGVADAKVQQAAPGIVKQTIGLQREMSRTSSRMGF